ncbi:MAG: hypothetical protein J1F12_05120 [Muribaculaceae bacterium]|nr:hypothetical protein [Muribaculaceae bacterium]
MKKTLGSSFILLLALQSCVANSETGEMGPGWLFWVFLGLLLGGVFIGAITSFLRKNKDDNTPSKSEEEIEAYEETLEKKLHKIEDKEEKEKEDKKK